VILDTNALSAWAEGLKAVKDRYRTAGRLVVPTVVLGEFYFGVRQSRDRTRYEGWLRRYLPLAELAMITRVTASEYAEVRLQLKRSGTPIPANDAWIAALARQHDLPVLSNDSHFDAVEGVQRLAF
jgi:predicted nucleic acid-binding protein